MHELTAPEFSLQVSLLSGQTFRWTFLDGWWYGFINSSVLKIRQDGDRLQFVSSDPALTPERVRRYFALDLDLAGILTTINVDMQIHHAIVRYRGLRVLRQDGWETLASFICASFNNIKRIEGMIDRLSQSYGEPVALNGFRGFSFPSPEALAAAPERRLRALGLGYRAPYLKATAKLVADGKLPVDHLLRVDYEAAKRALLACDGVGDKVADCVALFGFEKYEAFPVDIWMERAMRYYFRHKKTTRRLIHDYARRHFGAYAGYAQQYLYHYMRNARAGTN
jgi:N-glycosylase/DNA lyase